MGCGKEQWLCALINILDRKRGNYTCASLRVYSPMPLTHSHECTFKNHSCMLGHSIRTLSLIERQRSVWGEAWWVEQRFRNEKFPGCPRSCCLILGIEQGDTPCHRAPRAANQTLTKYGGKPTSLPVTPTQLSLPGLNASAAVMMSMFP